LTAVIMKEEEIRNRIEIARREWRRARDGKLARKGELLAGGADIAAARRDRHYRDFRQEQRRFAVVIRHLERRMNRTRARENKES
jgi:hypothetical protein